MSQKGAVCWNGNQQEKQRLTKSRHVKESIGRCLFEDLETAHPRNGNQQENQRLP